MFYDVTKRYEGEELDFDNIEDLLVFTDEKSYNDYMTSAFNYWADGVHGCTISVKKGKTEHSLNNIIDSPLFGTFAEDHAFYDNARHHELQPRTLC